MDNMETQLGYACINTHLRKSGIFTSRSMIKKTFNAKGIQYASELALQNSKDLVEIIKWNHANGIKLFRMSSGIFPWMSEYAISDLPDYTKISNILKGAGTLAKSYNQRLSFHPGPFVVLASPIPVSRRQINPRIKPTCGSHGSNGPTTIQLCKNQYTCWWRIWRQNSSNGSLLRKL